MTTNITQVAIKILDELHR